ncbi:MAG: hypothetical protein ABJB66_11960 [Gemmatimonadaceae bacterium]
MLNSQGFRLEDDVALRRVLYVTGFVLILVAYAQVINAVRPFGFGSLQWRLTALNILSENLNGPFLGEVIVLTVARFAGDKLMARAMGILAALTAIGLILSFGIFLLDVVQYKAIVKTVEMQRFNKAAYSTGITMLLFTFTSSLLAFAALRNLKAELKPVVKGAKTLSDEKPQGMLFGQDMKSK